MPTTPVLWKGSTQVNTSDGGVIQAHARIAPLQNGGYVVVWQDNSLVHNPGGGAIVGQVYNALGEKVGGEVLLSKLDDGHQADAFQAAVATLDNGNIAVAFLDHQGAGFGAIEVQIFDTALTLLRTDAIDGSGGAEPELAPLAGGGYAVTWTNLNTGTDWDVMARIVSPTGAVGAAFEIDTLDVSDRQASAEVATLSNGNFIAVWQDEAAGLTTDHDIKLRILTPAGAPVFANYVSAGLGFADEIRPDVAALKGGGFVVVWTDGGIDGTGSGIGAAVFDNTGEVVNAGDPGAPSELRGIHVNTATAGNQNDASVVALGDGGFVVVWEDEAANVTRGKRFDHGGNTIGSEFVLADSVAPSSNEATIQMTLLADGRVAFVATTFDGADFDVVTSIWDPRDAPNGGTEGADTLTSLVGGSTLSGLGGNDTLTGSINPDALDGGAGADVMQGGGGDDIYVVDNLGDQIVEVAGQGTDTVLSAISFALGANVENLTLIGTADINGTGNELANVITGNDAANVLGGGLGSDILTGSLGADTFVFNTALDAASNLDTIADFFVPDDTIHLDNAIFAKLKKDGELKKKYFEVGKKADDKDDFIVHNKKTGELFYDADGSKKKIDAIAFADLAEGLKLKADDFFVV